MTIEEIADKLLVNGYLVLIAGKPVLTAKFERALGYDSSPSTDTVVTIARPVSSNGLVKPTTYTNDLKEIWTAFIADCELPHRVSDNRGSTYTIRQFSKGIAGRLKKIIADPKIDYTRLVESTKYYYRTVSYKSILSNYIDKEIWLSEYENYNSSKLQDRVNDGSNRWETE